MGDSILIISDTPISHTLTIDNPDTTSNSMSIDTTKEVISILKVGIQPEDVMLNLIYDPRGVQKDVFNIDNLTGVVDCGEFT